MNTKELAAKLDAIAESARGLRAEDAAKRSRARALLAELSGMSPHPARPDDLDYMARSWINGRDRDEPEWRENIREKAYEVIREWVKEHL